MNRAIAPFAALACAASVALAAYASHAAQAQEQQRLAIASAFAFGHGLALLALPVRNGGWAQSSRIAFVLGIVLFSGSLALAAFFETSTMLAPAGGSLFILGWAMLSIDHLRHP